MVETRSGVGAGTQTSFWAIAFLLISVGAGIVQKEGATDTQMVVGAVLVVCGAAIIFAKYYIKLPDVSEKEMLETLAVFERAFDKWLLCAHRTRDEVVAHRQLIEASAAFLPSEWRKKLIDVLDVLEKKRSGQIGG